MKEKKPIFKKVWFWILIVFVIGGMSQALKDDPKKKSDDQPKTTETTSKSNEKEEPKKEEVKIPKIGETVKIGDVVYVVKAVDIKKAVGNEYLNTKAQGQFLILSLEVTNKGNKKITLLSNYFKLKLGEKTYEPSTEASIYITTDKEQNILLESINPDITFKGKIAFDVPEEVAKSPETMLEISGNIFGSEKGLISLKR